MQHYVPIHSFGRIAILAHNYIHLLREQDLFHVNNDDEASAIRLLL